MKKKKLIIIILIAVIVIACAGIAIKMLGSDHEHSFGEWETETPATCEAAEVEVRTCKCGEKETREGDPAIGHSFISISAESRMEKPMAGMVVTASDLSVTGTCDTCGQSAAITDGIELEDATLVLGKNTITVKYGELSTTLTIVAAELDVTLDGTVVDDTYVYSSKKDGQYATKKEMGTKSDLYRIYFRVNVSDVLENDLFLKNKDNARVQLALAITAGSVTDETTFTLKAYDPAAGVTDVDFSKLTWNSVDNNEGTEGKYSQLHWKNGTTLVSGGVGYNVSADNGSIVVTLAYSQIEDYIDSNGNVLFVFAANTTGLKVGSLENKVETNKPTFKVVLKDEHFHAFDQKVAENKYFVSANCKEKAKYYLSCSCGEASTMTFEYGEVIGHSYGSLIREQAKTCTTDGVKAHYQCGKCGKYFLYRDGQMKLVKAEDVKLSAGHDYKLIPQKDATCTAAGNNKYYKCAVCEKYFDADKNETTKDAQKIEKLDHTYSALIERKEKTCTEDGMKAHYRCTVCEKYFIEKEGQKVATSQESLKLPAGHTYKVVQKEQDPTCTKHGWHKVYKCDICQKYFDAEKNETEKETQRIPALGHTYTSISAESTLVDPMAGTEVKVSDLSVTGTCGTCGENAAITDGIELAGATTLALGENTITVNYGELTIDLTITAVENVITLDGSVSDDTYVDSSNKTSDNSGKETLNTNSTGYRTYFRVNVRDILSNEQFDEAKAKVRLTLAIVGGSAADSTAYTLKAYTPTAGVTDAEFSDLTWNSVSSGSAYSALNWSNGTALVSGGVGHNVSVKNGKIIITLAYSQIKDYIDGSGNILFAFGTNTSGLKVGSLENGTESNRPTFKVILSDAHFHVFNREAAEETYLASEATCTEAATYYKSCSCGAKGTDTFESGDPTSHAYTSISAESTLVDPMADTEVAVSDLRVTGTCGTCNKSYQITDGIELEDATLVLGENTITVKYGELSTTVTITAAEQDASTVTKTEKTVSGAIVDDTYVDSGNKTSDFSTSKNELNVRTKGTNYYRAYFRFDFSNVLNAERFAENKSNAKVQFTFTISSGTVPDGTTFTFKTFGLTGYDTNVSFSGINWDSVKNNGLDAGDTAGVALLDKKGVGDGTVVCSDNKIIITLNYSDIESYIDPTTGYCIFALTSTSTDLKVASEENTTYAHPAVSVTYSYSE